VLGLGGSGAAPSRTGVSPQPPSPHRDPPRSPAPSACRWGAEFKVVDVAYGIQKLIIALVLEDEKVGARPAGRGDERVLGWKEG
jgi:hypothetical protein